jgi:membrane protein implicated in regulation of membrane protease activity
MGFIIWLLGIAIFIALICLSAWSLDRWVRSLRKTPGEGGLQTLNERDGLIVETLTAALESHDWAIIADLRDELRH